MRGGCDARRHVDRRADIVAVDDECLARMGAHPDPERARPSMVTDRSLGIDRGARRGGCRLEGTEECVTFRAEHDAAGILDGRGDECPHLGEHVGVGAVAQLAEQPRGLLDVGKEKGHGAARQPAGDTTHAGPLLEARRIEVRIALDHPALELDRLCAR